MNPIKIVLADDHELVRDGIKSLLESEKEFHVIDEASDGVEALEVVALQNPDLLIVDIRMPKMNGLEVVKEMSKSFPHIKKLVLSMHDSEEYVVEAVEAGADGYLLKGSSKSEFLKALHTIAGGGKFFAGDVSAYIINNFVNGKAKSSSKSEVLPEELANLTNREKQILELILEGKGNNEIADALDISKRTAEVHRFNLMKKMNVKNLAELTTKSRDLNLI
ncbi:response regulator [Algoriphagus aquimarinus]|uniref:DNA-binding response regulator, NarL/FixJ family, contains REC and HTH domains n=1 Tax=Algoriphagus aquimarinus TaxID=237018 RepID=A0A1I1CJH8_9BACT|nr:response regulator transcription factor [Algoriphagus aquimarinus]SFB60800.1 DNA-binding response regulator, NarL/FixJ family, contains REC and HTH domains [Algoriphagus aquimarinus]